ncbi:MAG: DNA-processing protein DprA [Acidobacteriota bacterium]
MDSQDLLIALNANLRLHRAAICRLAGCLELWRDAAPGNRTLAATLGVPLVQLDRALASARSARDTARRSRLQAEKRGCRLILWGSEDYPTGLADLSLPPPVLYCRGTLPAGPAMAIVGSRRMNPYGREAADLFASSLAARGVTVVSGFALGVDQAAHQAALEVDGITLAILGCGLDIDYPRHSRRLADGIARRGALISEFPFGCSPRSWHFPVRNRLIAALASGVLVIQAKQRSGSLITAHLALELGREVFAVPGDIFEELSLGTNELIRDGAYPVSSPEDVLDHLALGWQQELFPQASPRREAPRIKTPGGTPGRILEVLETGKPRLAEELASELGKSVDSVLAALLELELAGLILRRPGPVYERLG